MGLNKLSYLHEENENVFFLGKLTPERLRNYYNKSQFYIQLSIFEGFSVALCEAMLCGCIPIGSSVNVIPEIIGDSGFIFHKKDITELENLIHKVLSVEHKDELGKKGRSANNEKLQYWEKGTGIDLFD